IGSGTAGEPGVAYDPDKVGEPVPPGVPTGDQYPTNERDNISMAGHGGATLMDDTPGTRPAGESVSSEPAPTEAATRQGGTLGELTEDVSTSEKASPATRHMATSDDPYSHEDADQARAERHS
ncbi:MAG: hypothetical protein M3325_09670, partial [Actinomycetota bacterium]|nr:hypothetical protein [Actinomycetota bacterium]